jgi:ketosteroid isomerase-like protein
MKRIFACLPVLLATGGQAAPVPAPTVAETQLRAINHRYVNAIAMADVAYVDDLAAAEFRLLSTKGDWIERARHLERVHETITDGRVSRDRAQVRLFGTVAILHGVIETSFDKHPSLRERYTNVYHWNGAGWRLVHAQNTALPDNVAREPIVGEAQPIALWQGQDPTGDDHDVLIELNASYVRAFREADVPWYEAHLSADYVVINSDGSLHDRATALGEFAKPEFTLHMRSFPVDKVRIRRFDDVALIDAENAYELKDGRKGTNRYTDVWRKQEDGRWLCVAAHITTHRAPG